MGKEGKNRKVKNAVLAIAIAAVLLGAAVGSASAIDGCVKIGGNSDDPDDVFTCGETVTESCTFNGNMSCTSGSHGLVIGADDITVEGYNATDNAYYGINKIEGDIFAKYGIYNYNSALERGYDNVNINNLTVTGFEDGIRVMGKLMTFGYICENIVESNTIYNCTVHDNGGVYGGHGIHFYQCVCNSTITECEVYNTSGMLYGSCDDPGAGIRLWGKTNFNNVTNNVVHHNVLAGIYSKKGGGNCYNTIAYNTVYENGQIDPQAYFTGGIRFQCKSTGDNTIENNIVTDNIGPGIFIGGNDCIVRNNTVTGSKDARDHPNGRGDGLRIDRGSDGGGKRTQVYDNTFCDNEHKDISADDSTQDTIGDDNTCNSCYNYNDTGTTCCTHKCSVCVGATQCFTCGDTVTESCTLNGDMSCPDTHGLLIAEDGITIDGNGYCIDGVNNDNCILDGNIRAGIFNPDPGFDYVTIKNLEVKNFCTGIHLAGKKNPWSGHCENNLENNTIDNCKVHDNGRQDLLTDGIHLEPCVCNSTITNSEVYNNTGADTGACDSAGMGIRILHASINNEVTNNSIHHNRHSGVYSKMKCEYTHVTYNNIYENGHIDATAPTGGIVLRCKLSDNWTIENNMIEDNYGPGIYIGGHYNTVKNNIVTGSKCRPSGDLLYGHGIYLGRGDDGSFYNTIFSNTVCDNEGTDIWVLGGCPGNHGDCNTCNTTSNYDDDGTTGCTFECGAPEGACVGATQCFTCGDTVTESCAFNGDMSCDPGQHGLIVGADNIVIDGNGFALAGSENATACQVVGQDNPQDGICGVLNEGYDSVTIKNLEIESFCDGIALHGEIFATIYDNLISNCSIHHNGNDTVGATRGMYMSYTNNCVITHNKIYNNTAGWSCGCGGGGNGIFMFGGAVEYGNYNEITHNEIYNNKKAGFFTKMQCMHNSLDNNTIYGNGAGGIVLRCMMSNYNLIEYNNVSNNYGSGIAPGGSNNIIRYNIVCANMNGSEYVSHCSLGSPTYEVAEYGVGIKYLGNTGSDNTLYNNTICENDAYDIEWKSTASITGDCNTCNTTSNYNDTGSIGCTYYCPGETDLTITDKYEQWFGTVYNVIYTIKNLGNSTAPESTTGISIDDILNKTDPVGLIGPGVSYIRTVGPFTMNGSEDTINVTADYENVISETNETNNCMENVFTGVVMPDLVITDKSEAWVDLVNKTYNVTYTVKNIGNADAGASDVGIYIDGVFNRTVSTKALAPEEEETKTVGPFTMSDESDTIRVCADNESVVEESNEENNCQQNTFEHPGIPDLVITRKYEQWVASNDTWRNYTITYTVKNVGTGDAGASTTATIIDDVEVATDPVGALGEGDSYTNTLGPFTMSNESDTIKVCADKNNDVAESNEDNNCTENTFDYSEAGCLAEDGTLFRCGNTVTKSCTFNGDMSCPFTDGLELGANSITINGNNSVLDGMGCTLDAMSRSGIYNKGYDDVTIKDLEVKGFCHGLYLYGTGAEGNVYRNTIKHCDIHHNGNASTTAGLFGITMKYVYNSTIRNNTVHHQIAGVDPNPGCEDGGNGMFLYKGNYNNFTYNDVYNNTKGGIFIKMQPMHNNISHNDLWDNGQGGIILRCMMSNYNTIEHNNASNNYGSGTFIGAKENTIRYNTVCDNRDGGLYYQDSVGGHGYGINLGRSDGSFDNYLHDNEICGNDYKDIYVVSGVTGNHGVNNTCDMTYNYDDTGTTGCTYLCAPGVCGDVDGLPGVTTNDGRQIFMYLLYGPEQYPIHDLWAADCDGLCDGITTNDGRQIFMNLLYGTDDYPLVCC